jgi:quinol monooxygenase YgiN
MIYVLATVEVAPGRRDEFLAEFRKVMPLVRAEEGCIEYGPAVDTPSGFPAQNPMRENTVVIVEKWDSLPALKAHLDAAHMHEYRSRVKDVVKSVTLQILAPA